MAKRLADDNIELFLKIQSMSLQTVFDFMVVSKQESKIIKWKESKSILAM